MTTRRWRPSAGIFRYLHREGVAAKDYADWQRHTPASEGQRPAAAEAKRQRRRARNLAIASRPREVAQARGNIARATPKGAR